VPPTPLNIRALFGDGPRRRYRPRGPDVAQFGRAGGWRARLCRRGSAHGAFALIDARHVPVSNKVINGAEAGADRGYPCLTGKAARIRAVAVFAQDAGIPAVIIGQHGCVRLKITCVPNPGATAATFDHDLHRPVERPATHGVAQTPSRGVLPRKFWTTQTFAIKPELVAPGADLYTAAQKLDPNGDATRHGL